eukprot:2922362-Pleurochrysis_carterae.AAC.1
MKQRAEDSLEAPLAEDWLKIQQQRGEREGGPRTKGCTVENNNAGNQPKGQYSGVNTQAGQQTEAAVKERSTTNERALAMKTAPPSEEEAAVNSGGWRTRETRRSPVYISTVYTWVPYVPHIRRYSNLAKNLGCYRWFPSLPGFGHHKRS